MPEVSLHELDAFAAFGELDGVDGVCSAGDEEVDFSVFDIGLEESGEFAVPIVSDILL